MHLESYGDMLIKANPDKDGVVNAGLLCGKGKWGFDCALLEGKLIDPMIKDGDDFRETDYQEALMLVAKKAQSIAAKYGKDAVAVSISDRYTNEEAYVMKKLAKSIGAKTLCFNNRASGIASVLGFDASPNTIDELLSTELILAIGHNVVDNPIIELKMKQAAENGTQVILINPQGYEQHMDFFAKTIYTKNDISVLKELAKALLDSGKTSDAEDFDQFARSLDKVKVSDQMAEVAAVYAKAKKAMIVYNQNFVTKEAATLIADIALLAGHIGTPRDGILQVKAKNNSQGIIDLGIHAGAEAMAGVKALLCFGEDPDADLSDLEFLMVSDTHMTKTASKANVILPGTGFANAEGTFTNTERRLQSVVSTVWEEVELNNWEIAAELAHIYEIEFDFEEEVDISTEMDDTLPKYKYAEIGEILGGVLVPESPRFEVVGKAKFVDPLTCTDNLMNVITERLPKPV